MWTLRRVDEWGEYHSPSVCFGKSAPAPPTPPNPTTVANAQSAADINTALATGAMNRVNQVTPFGNLTYVHTGNQATPSGANIPTFTADISLSPAEQQALGSQQSLTQSLFDLANNETGRVSGAVSQPFDTSHIPGLPTNPSGIDTNAMNLAFNANMDLLNPQFDQQQKMLDDKLATQGIQPDNVAALTEEQNFQNTRNLAEEQAASGAVSQGAQLGAQEFGQQTTANQNALQEASFLREQPLNEAIALMSGGQIQTPQFANTPQTSVAPTDVVGAFGLNQAGQNAAYQGQVSAANSGNAALAGGLGAAATAAAVIF